MSIDAAERSVALDDETLALDAAKESAAFAELYERYLFPVHRYVRSQVPDAATAEDLTAQVFYKSLISARTFRGEGSYRAWIFQIARNTVTTWRARRRNAEIPIPEIHEEIAASDAPVEPEPDEITATVYELPAAQREVILLRYWDDLTVDEIAETTRRSPGAVRQLLHRARARLRKNLSGADITALAGATGASALAIYSIARKKRKR
ncbi:MAG: RNA polymerase sigma factor [Actinomycetota bacterium]